MVSMNKPQSPSDQMTEGLYVSTISTNSGKVFDYIKIIL